VYYNDLRDEKLMDTPFPLMPIDDYELIDFIHFLDDLTPGREKIRHVAHMKTGPFIDFV
jgi:hypothetical protein